MFTSTQQADIAKAIALASTLED